MVTEIRNYVDDTSGYSLLASIRLLTPTVTLSPMSLATGLRRGLRDNLFTHKLVSIIAMANDRTVHTTGFLRTGDALPFSCMKGKLDPALLEGIDAMGLKVMTPVQNKVLNDLPSLESDWFVINIF